MDVDSKEFGQMYHRVGADERIVTLGCYYLPSHETIVP